MIRINLSSVFYCCHYAIPEIAKAGGGSIINVASVASSIKGAPNRFVYGATKAAAAGLTRSVALENGRFNVTANNISLGTMRTPMTEALWSEHADSPQAKAILQSYAIRRPGLPDDVTQLALLLASEHGSWITGQTICVNGGYSMTL